MFSHFRQLFFPGTGCCTVQEPARCKINSPSWACSTAASQMRSFRKTRNSGRRAAAQDRPPGGRPGAPRATVGCSSPPPPPRPVLLLDRSQGMPQAPPWVTGVTSSNHEAPVGFSFGSAPPGAHAPAPAPAGLCAGRRRAARVRTSRAACRPSKAFVEPLPSCAECHLPGTSISTLGRRTASDPPGVVCIQSRTKVHPPKLRKTRLPREARSTSAFGGQFIRVRSLQPPPPPRAGSGPQQQGPEGGDQAGLGPPGGRGQTP